MEKNTVFDFDITGDEIKLLHIHQPTKEEYLQNNSAKKLLQDLYVLFRIREDIAGIRKVGNRLFRRTG